MARVSVSFEEIDLENDKGYIVESVCATCAKCDHQVESYGVGPASRRRCLALLREECPEGDSNFYVDADGDEDE